MDKAIIKKIATGTSNFIIKNGKLKYYTLVSGRVTKVFDTPSRRICYPTIDVLAIASSANDRKPSDYKSEGTGK